MKVIVISGASAGVGKTTLARGLQRLLAGAEIIKLGHGRRKTGVGNRFYERGTPFETIRANHCDAHWLLVESNSILRKIQADLVVYLEGENPKPSAEYARRQADIISGRNISDDQVKALAARLEITVDLMQAILRLARAGASEWGEK